MMETITLSNKRYVVIEQRKFEQLQKLAAKKVPVQKKVTLEKGRQAAHKLIDEWVKER